MTTFWMGSNRRNTREDDYKLIEKDLKSSDPNKRRQAQIAKDRIGKESAKIRDMREALVKAHRDGNKAEVADIHDFVSKHSDYKNVW